jgi:hypothetical protein
MKFSKFFLISLSIIMGLMLNSCKDESTNTNETPKKIIPLKIGYTWSYYHYLSDDAGNITKDTIQALISDSRKFSIEGTDYQAYFWKEYLKDSIEPYAFCLIAPTSDGVYNLGSDSDTNSIQISHLWLKYPCSVNDSWNCVYYYYSYSDKQFFKDSCKISCINTNKEITIPLGTFRCYQFQYLLSFKNPNDTKTYEYYAPGVGLIKYERYYNDIKIEERLLIAYLLK